MARKFEQYNDVVNQDGLVTGKPVTLSGTAATLAVGGTSTFTGVATFTAAPVFTVAPTGPMTRTVNQSALVGATVVLAASDSGSININRSTSGSPSWTLPAATTSGLLYTFITANTTAGFTVTGAQVIHAKTSATGTAITTTTTLTNTQGTAVVGDHITIVSDGAVWWITSQSGIFAAS